MDGIDYEQKAKVALDAGIAQLEVMMLAFEAAIAFQSYAVQSSQRVLTEYQTQWRFLKHSRMMLDQPPYDPNATILFDPAATDALVGKQVQLRVENIEGVQTGRVTGGASEWINRITSVDTGFEPDPHEIALQMGRDCTYCNAKAGVKCHNLALGTTMDKPHKER